MQHDHSGHAPTEQAVTIHQPTPIPPPHTATAPLAAVPPGHVPAVTSIVLPDGRTVTGYTLTPTAPNPDPAPAPVSEQARPVASRTAVNIALGGVGFAAVCGGLMLLTSFIAALTAFVTQLVILAAVCFGGWIATQILGNGGRGGTTVNIRRAVFKRNHFNG